MTHKRELIGELLLKKGIITEAELDEALAEREKTHHQIGDILIKNKKAREEDIVQVLGEQQGFPYVDLTGYQIDEEVLGLISKDVAVKLQVVPLFSLGDVLNVAMANPLDVAAIDEMTRVSGGKRITPFIATPTGIKNAIGKLYQGSFKISGGASKARDSLVTQDDSRKLVE